MIVMRAALLAIVVSTGIANAADCPRKGTLGVSRILTVDAQAFPRVGKKSFPKTLPLAEKEVVLTFDDGPFPPTTTKILAALADQCVRATFFLIGKNAESNPELVRKMADAGHSIGHHTWSHQILNRIGTPRALAEIDRGIAATEMTLHGVASTSPSLPFFRFPGFVSTPALLASLQSRSIVVFGADLWAGDWTPMSAQQELRLLISRLETERKGIILLHDTKVQTARMLPQFLQYLQRNGYKVVHLTIAKPLQSQNDAR